MSDLITLPVAHPTAQWQLDLFQFAHQHIYRDISAIHTIVITKHAPGHPDVTWDVSTPHTKVKAFFDYLQLVDVDMIAAPINIQTGLAQVIDQFADDQVLEVVDCDMFHFRRCPPMAVPRGEVWASTIYEDWHLHSLGVYREVIAPYFENEGAYYNGGFVPIIARADTFRRILPEWIAVHLHILRRDLGTQVHWWAGMYALQAACEKHRVRMMAKDYCYAPPANSLAPSHYIGHYCVDKQFDKRVFPHTKPDGVGFPDNDYYQLIKHWLDD